MKSHRQKSQKNNDVENKEEQRPQDKKAALLLLVLTLFGVWFVFGLVWYVVTGVGAPSVPLPSVLERFQRGQEYTRLIDGASVSSTSAVAPPLIAVVIDHNFDAYPVSGVDKAQVVYEVPVEGGITRLLALVTADTNVEESGPVRSARPYIIDIAAEYSAAFLHVGGSPDAMDELRIRTDVLNLDQYYNDKYSWRDTNRYAPHNTYTSSKLWKRALENYSAPTSTMVDSWIFDTDEVDEGKDAVEVTVPSIRAPYNTDWEFSDGSYRRMFGDGQYATRQGVSIKVDTIIVQQVQTEVLDAVGRLEVDTESVGSAWVFRDGKVIEGTWKKRGTAKRTRWYDLEGNEIPLKPGKIWVHLIPTSVDPEFQN